MKKRVNLILLRYLIAIGLYFLLPLFYIILKPLTVYPVFAFARVLYSNVSLSNNILAIGSLNMEFIDACIAGSAYLLLLILNLITPMNFKKRIYIILFDFLALLVFNIIRIAILMILLVNGSASFDITHKFFWYFLSTAFVVGIWLLNIFIFKLKEIPAYSDVRLILSRIKK